MRSWKARISLSTPVCLSRRTWAGEWRLLCMMMCCVTCTEWSSVSSSGCRGGPRSGFTVTQLYGISTFLQNGKCLQFKWWDFFCVSSHFWSQGQAENSEDVWQWFGPMALTLCWKSASLSACTCTDSDCQIWSNVARRHRTFLQVTAQPHHLPRIPTPLQLSAQHLQNKIRKRIIHRQVQWSPVKEWSGLSCAQDKHQNFEALLSHVLGKKVTC